MDLRNKCLRDKCLQFVLAAALISGISIFINSYAVKGFDSSVFTFAKNALVAVFLVVIILGLRAWKEVQRLTRKDWLGLAALGLIGGSIPFLLYFRGVQLAGTASASFVHKMIFLPVAILAFVALRERVRAGIFIGATVLLAGTYLLAAPVIVWGTGLLFIIVAVLFWAGDNVLAKHLTEGMSGTIVAFGRMLFGSLFILAFLFSTGKAGIAVSMTGQQYLWILLTAALLLLYVFTFYNGLKRVKVTTATAMLSLGLPATAILDWAFKGTSVSLQAAMGVLLILIGVGAVMWLSTVNDSVKHTVTHGRQG